MGKLEANKQQKLTSLLNTAFNLFTTQGLRRLLLRKFLRKQVLLRVHFICTLRTKYDIRNRLISHESSKLFKNAVADLGGIF